MHKEQDMDELTINNSDWLAIFLKRSRLSPFSAAFILFIINLVVDFLLAFLFGGLWPSPKSHGLLNEPIAFTADLLVPSVLIGYYCWIQLAFAEIISSLIKERVIELNEKTSQLIKNASGYTNAKWVSVIILILSLGSASSFALSVPIANPLYMGWVSVNPIIPWVRSLFNALSIYAGGILILDIVVLIYVLTRIFNSQNIKVQFSHPDKAGGLSAIGRFAANLGYLIGVFGILVSVSLVSNTMPQGINSIWSFFLVKVGGLVLYLIAAPIIFFVPLYSAHIAMLKFRDTFLLDLGKEIDQEYSKVQKRRADLKAADLDDITKRIASFRELCSQAKEFPTWPFNAQNTRKFFSLSSGAILPGLMKTTVDFISSFFK
jgi:hypothetical protein